jgi:hypothetical protein
MNTTADPGEYANPHPDAGEHGNRDNHKLSTKSIEFDMKKDESVEMFGRMVEQLHKRGIVFTIHQDFNLIWICL